MKFIERKMFSDNGTHIGSVFTFLEPTKVDENNKKPIETMIANYVNDVLYDGRIGSIFSDINKDLASITVFFEINDLAYDTHDVDLS